MKIHQVGADLCHADGQTDMMNLIVNFRDFSKAPNKTYLRESNFSHSLNFFVTRFGSLFPHSYYGHSFPLFIPNSVNLPTDLTSVFHRSLFFRRSL
jgi:hypothetical protein